MLGIGLLLTLETVPHSLGRVFSFWESKAFMLSILSSVRTFGFCQFKTLEGTVGSFHQLVRSNPTGGNRSSAKHNQLFIHSASNSLVGILS